MADEKRKQGSPPTHGVQGLRNPQTSKWPLAIRRAHARRVAEIGALPHIDLRRHGGAVNQCVRYKVLIEMAYACVMRPAH